MARHPEQRSAVELKGTVMTPAGGSTTVTVADVIKDAENTVYTENVKREMMRSGKYRARDIYPTLSPELEKLFEAWKKTHPAAGVKPNVGG
jgi:hypothetical protein